MRFTDARPPSGTKKPVEHSSKNTGDVTLISASAMRQNGGICKRQNGRRRLSSRARSGTPRQDKRRYATHPTGAPIQGTAPPRAMPVAEPGDQPATAAAKEPARAFRTRPQSADRYRGRRPQSADQFHAAAVKRENEKAMRQALCREAPVKRPPLEPIAGDQWLSALERRIEHVANLAPGTMEDALAVTREPTSPRQCEDRRSGVGPVCHHGPPRPASAQRRSCVSSRPVSATRRSSRPVSATRQSRPQSDVLPSKVNKDNVADQQETKQNLMVVGLPRRPALTMQRAVDQRLPSEQRRDELRAVDQQQQFEQHREELRHLGVVDQDDDSLSDSRASSLSPDSERGNELYLEDDLGGWTYRRPEYVTACA